jgi:molybdopterin/thiamine biosynthesis adenylyltransferase
MAEVVPGLKPCVWQRTGDDLVVMLRPGQLLTIADAGRQIELLLQLLRDGTRPIETLCRDVAASSPGLTPAAAAEALDQLDCLGFLEDRAAASPRGEDSGRFDSNRSFFDSFSTLHLSSDELQRRVVDSHVLVLGTGGLGSMMVMNLAGLGVGRLTLLDFDRVEPRNFARQFLYRTVDLGKPKVVRAAQWVREFDPAIEVRAVDRQVAGADDIAELLSGVDLVVRAVDQPADAIAGWVNQACVPAGVPHVAGGMSGSRLSYYSVDPAAGSACHKCATLAEQQDEKRYLDRGYSPSRMRQQLAIRNPGIGPFASLLGSLVAMEALRYLSRFAKPIAAGALHTMDVSGDDAPTVLRWEKRVDCPTCVAHVLRPAE